MNKLLVVSLLGLSILFGQTNLSAGDAAIIGSNFDDPDDFALLLFVNIEIGTVIKFTDNGWLSTNSFRSGEGIQTFTAASAYSAGDVIGFVTNAAEFTSSGSMNLAGAGDQILVYQGTELSPTFITAINSEGAAIWQADATSSNTSALPQGLTNGVNALALTEIDNFIFNGITTGTVSELKAAIFNTANWTGDDLTRQTMPTSFTISASSELSLSILPTLFDSSRTTASFTWTASDSATSRIRWGTISGTYTDSLTSLDSLATDSVFLTGLTEDTEYFYNVTLFATEFVGDTTLAEATFSTVPKIAFSVAPTASPINANDATLSFTTNLPAFGSIEYGQTLSYGLSKDFSSNTAHTESLTSLIPSTTYFYRVTANYSAYRDTVITTGSFTTVAQVLGVAGDLFFSEYIEGSSNNKAIEIFNGTGGTVDLAAGNYTVEVYSNGSASVGSTYSLTGNLSNDSVFVISNSGAALVGITNNSDATSGVAGFNGNDALVLKHNGTIIDVFGEVGVNPGTAWDVAGTSGATADHTLVRKATISSGNTSWTSSAGTTAENSEWLVFAQDFTDSLGTHGFAPITHFLYPTNVLLSTVNMADDQSLYTAFAISLTADSLIDIDSLSFNNIGSSDLSSVNRAILYINSTALDTLNSPSTSLLRFHYNLASQSYNSSTDSVYLRLQFNSFIANQNVQFELTDKTAFYSSDDHGVVGSFPMTGPELNYSFLYNVVPVSSSNKSIAAGTESWQGYFSIDQTNTVTRVSISNRVSAGTVAASDISMLYIYVTGSTLDPTAGTATDSATFVDDAQGGNATINFAVPQSTTGNFFHIVYRLSGSINTANSVGTSLDTLALTNAMTLNGSFPIQLLNDITLPVSLAPMSYLDKGKAGLELVVKTYSEESPSVLRLMRSAGEERVQIAEFETNGSVSHGKEYVFTDKTAAYGREYTYTLYENNQLTDKSLIVNRVPTQIEISSAYPNPFNPTTAVQITLPERSAIDVAVYNVIGQIVYKTQMRNVPLGQLMLPWNGRNNVGASVASGIYFFRVTVHGASGLTSLNKIQKIILVK